MTAQIPMDRKFLDKGYCIHKMCIVRHLWNYDIEILEGAKEIYAHAWMHYHLPLKVVRKHTNIIDLGGDGRFRKFIYRMIWRIF